MYATSVNKNLKANQVSSRTYYVRTGSPLVGFSVGDSKMPNKTKREAINGKLRCTHCRRWKKKESFTPRLKTTRGYTHWCRDCLRQRHNSYYANPEVKERAHRRYLENKKNPEWRARRQQQSDSWRHKNRDRVRINARKNYKKWLPARLVQLAKVRSEKKQIPFSITKDNFVIPKLCPVLGIELKQGRGHSCPNSPSLDRIVPEKGYVKGNIIVVSHKANSIKNAGTATEIGRVYRFYKAICDQEASKSDWYYDSNN